MFLTAYNLKTLQCLHVVLQDAEEYTQLPVRHNEDIINRSACNISIGLSLLLP